MEKAIFRILFLGLFSASTLLSFSQTGYDYSGIVVYQNGNPLNGVIATLQASDGSVVGIDTTDNSGTYLFSEISAGTYTINFVMNAVSDGVELDDAYMILEYLDGEREFDEIQFLAADVNGNGVINMGDHQMIVNHYLNRGNPFPEAWVFEPATIQIPSESRDGELKLGSSSGDVNGSLQPDPKKNEIFYENPDFQLIKKSTDPIAFIVTSPDNLMLNGMHLIFRIPDELNFIRMESAVPGIDYCLKDGLLKVTLTDATRNGFELLNDKPFLTIITEEKNTRPYGNSYHIALGDDSHFMGIDGMLLSGVKLSVPDITVVNQSDFSLKSYPNPFLSNLTLEYQLAEEGMVSISLFDQYGRLIMDVEDGYFSAGEHMVKLDGSSLAPGIYHYSIKIDGQIRQVDNGIIIKSK